MSSDELSRLVQVMYGAYAPTREVFMVGKVKNPFATPRAMEFRVMDMDGVAYSQVPYYDMWSGLDGPRRPYEARPLQRREHGYRVERWGVVQPNSGAQATTALTPDGGFRDYYLGTEAQARAAAERLNLRFGLV